MKSERIYLLIVLLKSFVLCKVLSDCYLKNKIRLKILLKYAQNDSNKIYR